MITTSKLINIVRAHVVASALKTAISGGVYKRSRPQGSDKEDVVINSLPVTNEQLQAAVLNVNVFVPDLTVKIGTTTETQPDNVRIEALEEIAVSIFQDIAIEHEGRFINYGVQQVMTFKDDESAQHYINIRLQFFISNI